ncbi:hypothetical protein D9758_006313 [Tetrapyrgos nigripes]|uniref:Uncharacterized protein n=1 Tax=Tetrapyrgos nigripes TaxID=182062 RepID=A0A8H5D874_9AGAR|nr:hypothetical protein D9758_006313 [Tetrapyrgos nigripes]
MPRTRNTTHTNQSIPDTTDTPRPRRRVKAPVGELGRKLKEKATPSSLPPSSPILSPSSHHDSLPVASSEGIQPTVTKWWQEREDGVDGDADPEYYQMDEEEDEAHSPPSPQYIRPSQASDPFGFFAVEQKLKEERLKHPPPPPKPKPCIRPPPSISTESLKPPRTPHKRGIGKRPSATFSDTSSANILDDLLPSSPSPMKRPAKRRPLVDEPSAENITADEEEQQSLPRNGRKKKARATSSVDDEEPQPSKGVRKKKTRASSPDRLAKDLRALLPRRRGTAAHQRRKRTEDSDDESEEEKTSRRKDKGRTVKKRDVSEMPVEDEEKWADERKARLEYFKKLEAYQVHKENVYVV